MRSKESRVTALLDADIIVWKACALSQDTIDLGGEPLSNPNWGKMKRLANKMIDERVSAVGASEYIVVVSDRTPGAKSFRFDVDATYHKNRKNLTRPALFEDLHWMIVDKYDAVFRTGLEGDDILGILATNGEVDNAVIVSEDKDMFTISSGVWVPGKSDEIYWVSEDEANYRWLYQTLVGDVADGYPGCRGIGPVKADKALAGCVDLCDLWEAVEETFGDRDAAVTQARLARILRSEDIDPDWNEVYLWHPIEHATLVLPAQSERKQNDDEQERPY